MSIEKPDDESEIQPLAEIPEITKSDVCDSPTLASPLNQSHHL